MVDSTPSAGWRCSHSAYPALVRLYRMARAAWASSPGVREAAALIGVDERAYCDQYAVLYGGGVAWTSTSTTNSELTVAHFDQAFTEAKP